ncbi:hypothetical protein Agabi119p4_8390 [Agaricus bisporus var. burnettii]|uniref:Uncharacterized protein n=1 Tax=Agaricus bisporus var. burnettii TaxID=192524 RepID=A0A8H7C7V5_AGABI|nr:hypothetical protein Agabi119p4_8390 [Agaricus bisporus var. burnettii]
MTPGLIPCEEADRSQTATPHSEKYINPSPQLSISSQLFLELSLPMRTRSTLEHACDRCSTSVVGQEIPSSTYAL